MWSVQLPHRLHCHSPQNSLCSIFQIELLSRLLHSSIISHSYVDSSDRTYALDAGCSIHSWWLLMHQVNEKQFFEIHIRRCCSSDWQLIGRIKNLRPGNDNHTFEHCTLKIESVFVQLRIVYTLLKHISNVRKIIFSCFDCNSRKTNWIVIGMKHKWKFSALCTVHLWTMVNTFSHHSIVSHFIKYVLYIRSMNIAIGLCVMRYAAMVLIRSQTESMAGYYGFLISKMLHSLAMRCVRFVQSTKC